jgi:hypothetical protein
LFANKENRRTSMKLKEKVSWLMGRLQRSLFPQLEQCCVSSLSEQEKHLVKVLEVIEIERHIPKNLQWTGRPAAERRAIGRSFVAKAVLGYPHTRSLINELRARPNLRLICGFTKQRDIPSESTFSRAFADFASRELGAVVHDTLVQDYLQGELIGHVSRDSTAIIGREKAARKEKIVKVSRKRGRPAKGEQRPPAEEKRLDRQVRQEPAVALAELPKVCNRGTKRNAKGYQESWNGYKLHADVNDTMLPLSVLLTSASVHDSQVAIPLMKLTSSKITYCYDLMDAAYDARQIWEQSQQLGHVAIIDRNQRHGGEVRPMSTHAAKRYNERSSVERFNGRLKEEFGGRTVMVRGPAKVMMHLMFGVVALFADQLIRLTGY